MSSWIHELIELIESMSSWIHDFCEFYAVG
jgi:hypothetical protein